MKELETLPLDQNYSERIIKAGINKALKKTARNELRNIKKTVKKHYPERIIKAAINKALKNSPKWIKKCKKKKKQ